MPTRMINAESQALPETYFNVDVAGLAQFVICAADEDFAYLRLREYCKDNEFLGVDPDSHFDIFTEVVPSTEDESTFFRKSQLGHNVVRLVGYTETNTLALPGPKNIRIPSFRDPVQLQLFSSQ